MKKNIFSIILLYLCVCNLSFAQDTNYDPIDSLRNLRFHSEDFKSIDSLKIVDDVKNEYVVGEVINISYTNPTKTKLYVCVTLERKGDDGWECYFGDVFNNNDYLVDPNDENIIYIWQKSDFSGSILTPIRKTKKESWKITNCLYKDEPIGLFRLKYTIGLIPPCVFESRDKNHVLPTKICYSKPFYVKKNRNVNIKMYKNSKNKFYFHP